MTTIVEEREEDLAFSQLLNLPDESAVPDFNDVTTAAEALQPGPEWCPDHLDSTNCFCNGFVGDWDVPAATTEEGLTTGVEEPDYSRFENWIPRFVRPEKPCDYCRSRRLQCYMQRGEPFCTSCATLFRECSLTKSNTLEANNYIQMHNGTFLDTLHVVDEDTCKEHGTLTGIKTLRSKNNNSGSTTPVRGDDAPGSSKRNGIRFPRHAVKTLRDWLDSHAENPYPTEEEKAELRKATELKPDQIANWLANARRRRKATEKSRPRVAESPTLRPTTSAIPIPGADADKPWDELNPFERWKNSPPENEPASMWDIANAVANNQIPDDEASASPSTLGRSSKRRKGSSDGSSLSIRRAPSTTSLETKQTSSISSSSAAWSKTSSHSTHGSFGSFSSSLAGKKDRRRRRRPAPAAAAGRKPSDDRKRIFQCTFCTDTFKSKYDWTRHEKSLHLSLEKWICAPLGPIITNQETGEKQCVYCDLHNPSRDHIESHNHRQCEDKGQDARTFYRKDHLRQHLRLMHGCEMVPSMESWKSTAVNINSRCGFCSQRFTVWQERVDHLTAHFKAGARMSEWKGCRGLDPAVAAQVTNAMPPYLIGIEAVSPNPFSASNRASWRNANEFADSATDQAREAAQEGTMCGPGKSTCWEVLTVRLGKFAKAMADQGTVMTDEMLQRQARQILYDSDDPWNQTAADNPEWLDLFKKAHGLNFIPSDIGGQGDQVPSDLETYGDLGLRIPFAVQLQAYNQVQSGNHSTDAATRPGPYQCEQARSSLFEVYDLLSKECAFYDGDQKCVHMACADNVMNLGPETNDAAKRWCTQEISPAAAHKLLTVMGIGSGNRTLSSPGEDRSRALQSLARADCFEIGHDCDRSAPAGVARSQALNSLSLLESAACSRNAVGFHGSSEQVSADPSKDDFAALQALRGYLPRHKYRLPQEQARLFATTTGAWEDCGTMPPAVQTSLPNIEETTSTGAMMEFLGGNIGSSLAFANDAQTSDIPLNNNPENGWQLPGGGTVSQEEMMSQLNELVNSTTSAGHEGFIPGLTAMDIDWTTGEMDSAMTAPAGDDMNFDDLTFEDVFDMPLDESFGTG